jgi:hypothetical protein
MTNSDSMDCDLFSGAGFSTVVNSSANCTASDNLTETFKIDDDNGLAGSTTYYLRIEGESSTATASTYNITVASASGN